jgi:hypothetical protein
MPDLNQNNWPTFDNGELALSGMSVATSTGPRVIGRISADDNGWRMESRRDSGYQLLAQGRYSDHPRRG